MPATKRCAKAGKTLCLQAPETGWADLMDDLRIKRVVIRGEDPAPSACLAQPLAFQQRLAGLAINTYADVSRMPYMTGAEQFANVFAIRLLDKLLAEGLVVLPEAPKPAPDPAGG